MMSVPFKIIETIRASYWFLPALMACLAALLGAGMVWLSAGAGSDWLDGLSWYQSVKPDGAQEVLSTIAGSMITVAGVVFSITIVAIAYASSQYGPRILTNFMSDRGNQVTLGTFIATFIYCLVVLRTIRAGDEEFVPHMAIMVGLLLAFCSIGVLIYFIHHVPQSIHINNVVERIGNQLIRQIKDRYPAVCEGEPATDSSASAGRPLSARDNDTGVLIPSEATGYIQAIDQRALIKAACSNDLTLKLHHEPGDYVYQSRSILVASPAQQVSDEVLATLRDCFTIGAKRSPDGDVAFLIDELVEIAARALSTGVNDPYTAMTCMDWLGAGASGIARRRPPPTEHADGNGIIRVTVAPQNFERWVQRGFGRVRQYVSRDMNASLHMLRTLGEIAASCRTEEQITELQDEANRLLLLCEEELHGPALEAVCRRAGNLREMLSTGVGQAAVLQPSWLGDCLAN